MSASITASSATASGSSSVSPAQAAQLLQLGQANMVDVREVDEHRREHVAGAALHPSSMFSVTGFPAATPGRRTLVLCRSGGRAGKVVAALQAAGRQDVAVIEGGITAWRASGLPVVTDVSAPMPIVRQVMITVGVLVLACTALAATVSPWFLAAIGFMGAGLVFAGATGICAMATVLAKMPWNRAPGRPVGAASSCSTAGKGSCCG
jgi:rhodanese-related sulfurtransferase